MMRTRCPHCQTLFRVTAAQLRARGGRVRCGRCERIFDALAELSEEPRLVGVTPRTTELGPTAPAAQVSAAHTEALATSPAPLTRPSVPAALAGDASSAGPSSEQAAPAPESAEREGPAEASAEATKPNDVVTPGKATAAGEAAPAEDEPAPHAADGATPASTADSAAQTSATTPFQPAPSSPAAVEAAPTSQSEAAPLAPSDAPIARRPRRWPWRLGSILLLLLALAQAVHDWRIEIAARWPSSRPLLVAWCEQLGCDLPYPRQPDQLLLLHSDLGSLTEGRYELLATLRNRSSYPVAFPHLELTLTDQRDQALARRVLTPVQWLPKGHDPTSGFPPGEDIDIRVAFETDLPAVGYRIYFFYP